MKLLALLALGLLLVAGCTSAPPEKPPANNTTMSCSQYCLTQPHPQCVGEWKISGTYPSCVCSFECASQNTTPPAQPPAQPPVAPPVQPLPANITNTTPPPSPPPANVTPPPPPPPAGKIIEIKASQWKFEPDTITVKKGESVKLIITSQDVTHGFSLPAFNIQETLKPGQTVTVEFVPDKAGTFPFRCTVFCGSGHSGMDGTLIVEE